MKQYITDYGSYSFIYERKFHKNIGLLNIETNNTIELITFCNDEDVYSDKYACDYKVLSCV